MLIGVWAKCGGVLLCLVKICQCSKLGKILSWVAWRQLSLSYGLGEHALQVRACICDVEFGSDISSMFADGGRGDVFSGCYFLGGASLVDHPADAYFGWRKFRQGSGQAVHKWRGYRVNRQFNLLDHADVMLSQALSEHCEHREHHAVQVALNGLPQAVTLILDNAHEFLQRYVLSFQVDVGVQEFGGALSQFVFGVGLRGDVL